MNAAQIINDNMTLEKPDNLVELFESSVARFSNNTFFGTKNGKNGQIDHHYPV